MTEPKPEDISEKFNDDREYATDIKEVKQAWPIRFRAFMLSTACSIYVSHFLSSWGDRMWAYAVGMYLAELSPHNLRLVASYGFSMGASQVIMGAIIGAAVDRLPRLQVARTVLAGQNILVTLCAVLVCLVFRFRTEIYRESWSSGLCEAGIIILAVIATLFSLARTLAIEKDWISVICEGDSVKLAKLSSIMRAIEQFSNIAAPIVTGFLMTFGSMIISAIFIVCWNIISVFVEYALLARIYDQVPDLAIKNKHSSSSSEEPEKSIVNYDSSRGTVNIAYDDFSDATSAPPPVQSQLSEVSLEDGEIKMHVATTITPTKPKSRKRKLKSCCKLMGTKMMEPITDITGGWSVYFGYDVKYAGLGLSCVYMTVLSFHEITSAYAYYQGASQAAIGGMMAVSSVIGIAASFAYPKIRERVGIERTGLYGSLSQIIALSLCVVSVWLPGSPFMLAPHPHSGNMSTAYNHSLINDLDSNGDPAFSFLSLGMLMAGIITARFGLWTFDLAISQLLLERVDPSQRGVVNGVQSSLNNIMDMLQFVLVIAVPRPAHFGFLVIISFCFVCFGGISYSIYSRKIRGHLFHCCGSVEDQTGRTSKRKGSDRLEVNSVMRQLG